MKYVLLFVGVFFITSMIGRYYRHRNALKFIYCDADGRVTTRAVIDWYDDGAYVKGTCLKRNDIRTFRKDRIQKLIQGDIQLPQKEIHRPAPPIPIKSDQSEILFTEFHKPECETLEELARSHNMLVCTRGNTRP